MLQWDAGWQTEADDLGYMSRMVTKIYCVVHDSAHPYPAAPTVETFQQLCFEILEHPLYNSDNVQSDFYLLWPLRSALRGFCFYIVCELKKVVHVWLSTQLIALCIYNGMHNLVQCWIKGAEMAEALC
jgi:hypothetical protein